LVFNRQAQANYAANRSPRESRPTPAFLVFYDETARTLDLLPAILLLFNCTPMLPFPMEGYMIDLATEEVVPLDQLPELIPALRSLNGEPKRLALSTIYRWTAAGCRGVVLESIQLGNTRCSSLAAYRRFCQRLTEARDSRRKAGPVAVSG
jgi:hypothetical protein